MHAAAFACSSPSTAIATIRLWTGRRAAATAVNPGVSEELASVIDKALAKDPSARYPTAAELLADIASRSCLDAPSRESDNGTSCLSLYGLNATSLLEPATKMRPLAAMGELNGFAPVAVFPCASPSETIAPVSPSTPISFS